MSDLHGEHIRINLRMEQAMRDIRHRTDDAYTQLREALESAVSRFSDLADLIDEKGAYKDAGFLRASAERYRAAIDVADETLRRPIQS